MNMRDGKRTSLLECLGVFDILHHQPSLSFKNASVD
jgi:hypothetical protein